MLIVGIDTSGRQGSVALLRAEGEQTETLEIAYISGGQYSELLVPTIARLLESHGVQRNTIGLIAVASGPGTFTGLRIAIATVKGLAEAFAIPVVAVSVLEALALAVHPEGKAIAALDAQRSEVFYAGCRASTSDPNEHSENREGIASFEDFTSVLSVSEPSPTVFTPDEALATRLREAECVVEIVVRPNAEAFARIGYRKFLAGVRSDVVTLDANYLRRSDAEIYCAPRSGTTPR